MSDSILSLTADTINPNVKSMEYAVRGPLVLHAAEIEQEIRSGAKKEFDEVIRANTGDCQAMGQPPITFIRQILSLAIQPELAEQVKFPEDVRDRVHTLLKACSGESLGSYTESLGLETIRRHVQKFIEERDGAPSDFRNIILTAGATQGIKSVLQLLNCPANGKKAGIMVPIPQYPLYSATIVEQGMHLIPYFLEEETNWGLNIKELETSIQEARKVSIPRAIVIINPGNPTGQVLTTANMQDIIKFAFKENLVILADEVYQHNIYSDGLEFTSFKKALYEMGAPYKGMALASFLSVSKGYTGECGLRGGYVEVFNFPDDVKAAYYKSLSAHVCSNSVGQAAVFCLVNPPKKGEPSYQLYERERTAILESLKERAELVYNMFNSSAGFSCTPIQGSMYAFPQFTVPEKAIEEAARRGISPDQFWAFELLEHTGVCIVPGSGFGQKPGTYHFRTTILPKKDKLIDMLVKIRKFHSIFISKFS